VPSIYRWDSRDYPYDASMKNLAKARASERWHPPRPWRSQEEGLMVQRLIIWWLTCRDRSRPSGRAWALANLGSVTPGCRKWSEDLRRTRTK